MNKSCVSELLKFYDPITRSFYIPTIEDGMEDEMVLTPSGTELNLSAPAENFTDDGRLTDVTAEN